MIIEKLDLHHKDKLFSKLKKVNTMISEYSFANLYLFRRAHNYEIIEDGEIYIKGITYDGKNYIMPTIPFNELDLNKVQEISKEVDFVFPLDYEWLKEIEDKYCITSNPNDTDYIFTVDKMSTFKGRNLHGKRNLLKQFTENYSCTIKPLIDENKKDAYCIVEKWQETIGEAPEDTDFYANIEAIKFCDELVICGLIYYISDKPVGLIMGEEIRKDTFAIHFAKALKGYKGIYQYIYNSFANMLPKKYEYLNFEQDLGKPSLRQAKSSYEPDIMLHKYRLTLRERCL